MMGWFWIVVGVYIAGFIVIFVFHIMYLQMVTPDLAFLRAAVWPWFILTGQPHGQHLPMD